MGYAVGMSHEPLDKYPDYTDISCCLYHGLSRPFFCFLYLSFFAHIFKNLSDTLCEIYKKLQGNVAAHLFFFEFI